MKAGVKLKWATFLSIETSTSHRAEVWLVNFDPTLGAEIKKRRPAVIISSNAVGKLPIKLIAPITAWQDSFRGNVWHVRIDPSALNGLTKPSAVDALQLRGVDTKRFIKKLGVLEVSEMQAITEAVALVVEYAP